MVKNMNNIIVIGDLNYNLNIFLNTFLKENSEYTINNITKSIGNIWIINERTENFSYFKFEAFFKNLFEYLSIRGVNKLTRGRI